MRLLAAIAAAWSGIASGSIEVADSFQARAKAALAMKYAEARIELGGPVSWSKGRPIVGVRSVTLLDENARGTARFMVMSLDNIESDEAQISFAAWTPIRLAARRIHPGERIIAEMFVIQDVNLAVGSPREFRGLIPHQSLALSSLQARQTIIEGQMLLTSAVERIPDVRRGDGVTIRLLSGSLLINTAGTADEAAIVDSSVRVTTGKTKRQLVGTLKADGIVEVKL